MTTSRLLSAGMIMALAGYMLATSCKKIDKTQTPLTRIQRNWKLVKTATDGNSNGQIDAAEIQPVDASIYTTLIFNSDYSGKETVIANGNTTDYQFTWSMDAGMDSITRVGVGHNTIKYYLAEISSVSMELVTTTNQGLVAYFYEIK